MTKKAVFDAEIIMGNAAFEGYGLRKNGVKKIDSEAVFAKGEGSQGCLSP